MAAQQPGGWEGGRVWAVLGGAVAVITLAILAAGGFSVPAIHLAVRVTARLSELLFLSTFIASASARMWPGTASRWLLRNRRWLGLTFAVSQALHLAGILALAVQVPSATFAPLTLAGGGLAYVFIAAMAATSSDAAVRALGPRRWKLLHRTGSWWIFIVFAQNYLVAPFVNPAYTPLGLATAGALALRITAWWQARR
jgi:hypothetical protein